MPVAKRPALASRRQKHVLFVAARATIVKHVAAPAPAAMAANLASCAAPAMTASLASCAAPAMAVDLASARALEPGSAPLSATAPAYVPAHGTEEFSPKDMSASAKATYSAIARTAGKTKEELNLSLKSRSRSWA